MAKIAPSPVLGKASGAYFGVVVANGRNGLVMRRAARYKRAQSDLQREAALRMSLVSALWPDLPTETVEAWNDYAETLHRRDRVTGQEYSPTGFNAFTGLACKVLQVDPDAEVPLLPPTGVFMGDALVLSVDSDGTPLSAVPLTPYPLSPGGARGRSEALSRADGATARPHKGERSRNPRDNEPRDAAEPLTPCPLSSGVALGSSGLHPSTRASWASGVARGEGTVRWTADIPNSPGTVTELLWEKLPNKNRKPTRRWRTAGFHHFAQGAMSVETPAGPGWYVVGYRYVEAATGRVVGGWTIGRLLVEG
ncbi:MAG: hypothetical protein JST30_14645 [Armatimonadetes bacterium]|nr:hypothetical protein [Armatimonadota bacterium]